MKEKQAMEEIMKAKLDQRKVELKPEWLENMSEQLDAFNDKERKKRFLLWFFIAGLGIVGLSTVSFFAFNNANE